MHSKGPRRELITTALAAAALLVVASAGAAAQGDYPSRAIKIIVPFPAGGTVDVLTRIVGERLAAKWGQPVVVENRVGAAGNIGTEAAARAEPDGYTLLAAPPPTLVINQSLPAKLSYDPAAFVPVTVMGAVPNVLAINPDVPVGSVSELVAYTKANPDKLSFASTGPASMLHLSMEMLRAKTGIAIRYINYARGVSLMDLLAGRVDLVFYPLADLRPHIIEGKLRALAVASEQRIPELPNVPTVAETIPGFHFDIWYAVVAPPKTPAPIATKLAAAIAEAMQEPAVAAKLRDLAVITIGGTPADTAAFLKKEVERWREVVVATGAKSE
jgi:tripartite-type tricarboxylate transporter receptor subunit TctC